MADEREIEIDGLPDNTDVDIVEEGSHDDVPVVVVDNALVAKAIAGLEDSLETIVSEIQKQKVDFPAVQEVAGKVDLVDKNISVDFSSLLAALNAIAKLAADKNVIVKNTKDYPDLRPDIKRLESVINKLADRKVNISVNAPDKVEALITNRKPSQAIPVTLTDIAQRKFVESVSSIVSRSGGGSSGSQFPNALILNGAIKVINPDGTPIGGSGGGATEATLQDVLTALQNISIDADSVNLNTDQLETLIAASNALLTSIDGKDFATSSKQDDQTTKLEDIKTKLDTLHGDVDGAEGLLTQIRDYVDTVETKLQTMIDQTDTLESNTTGLATSLNQTTEITRLSEIRDYLDTAETKLQSIIDNTGDLEVNTDGVETLITASNALLTTIRDNADTVEAKLQAIADNTDTLEVNTDGLETLVTTTNTLLTTIRDNSDQLEGYLDTVETKLQSIIDNTDTLEVNTDGLETLVTATNALLTTIRDNSDQLEGYLDTVESKLQSIMDNTDGIEGLITSTNALLTTIRDNADTVESLLTTLNAKDFATQTTLATRLSESDFDTKTGSLTETAPVSDTASSGLNGRLQRIAQRITSLIALFPSSIGQKTKSGSLSVVLASDSTLPQGDAPTAVYNNQVTVVTAGTRVALAGSTAISGVIVQALSTNSGNVFVGSSTVTASNGFELQPGQATSVAIDNLNKVYVDAATNGDKVCYVAF